METKLTKLERALTGLLIPLVRFGLRRGLKFQEFLYCLKQAFLISAEQEIRASKLPYTISRASILTGLQRKDIKKLNHPLTEERENTNLLTRIIGLWLHDSRFRDKKGNPLRLTFEGAESQFAELVHCVSVDLSPHTVLYGLEHSGNIIKTGKTIELKQHAYVPGDTLLEQMDLLTRDSADLLSAVEENVFTRPATPNLHITTEFDNICKQDLLKLREWLLDQGTIFHEKTRNYLAQFDKDTNQRLYKKTGGARVVIGSFSFTEEIHSKGGKDV
jgi:hypothetical protein